jgi:hypothetical protein
MRFIELTTKDDSKIMVNIDKIVWFNQDNRLTTAIIFGIDDFLLVKESVEDIKNKIPGYLIC